MEGEQGWRRVALVRVRGVESGAKDLMEGEDGRVGRGGCDVGWEGLEGREEEAMTEGGRSWKGGVEVDLMEGGRGWNGGGALDGERDWLEGRAIESAAQTPLSFFHPPFVYLSQAWPWPRPSCSTSPPSPTTGPCPLRCSPIPSSPLW